MKCLPSPVPTDYKPSLAFFNLPETAILSDSPLTTQ